MKCRDTRMKKPKLRFTRHEKIQSAQGARRRDGIGPGFSLPVTVPVESVRPDRPVDRTGR